MLNIMLIVAIIISIPNLVQIEYYILLRWVICVICAFNIFVSKKVYTEKLFDGFGGFLLGFIFVFNPIYVLPLEKGEWMIADLIFVVVLLAINNLAKKGPLNIEYQLSVEQQSLKKRKT